MEKIYIQIPYENNEYSDLLKNTANEYCQVVNNLIHKAIITKNNKQYETLVKQYIKDVNQVKRNISNLIIANYIIDNVKCNGKLIDENEFKQIFSITQLLTENIEIYTDDILIKNNVLLFLFNNHRLMYNIF